MVHRKGGHPMVDKRCKGPQCLDRLVDRYPRQQVVVETKERRVLRHECCDGAATVVRSVNSTIFKLEHPLSLCTSDLLHNILQKQTNPTERRNQELKKTLRLSVRDDQKHWEGSPHSPDSLRSVTLLEAEDEENLEVLEKELQDLQAEEARLMRELASLKEQEEATEKAIAEQEREKERLDSEQEKYWREYTQHRWELTLTEDESKSLECQLHYTQAQLDKLKKTNVFNATFHIWHSGHFGTINNFRLGRLPSVPVDWSEINAAWGQTTLLLTALARKMNLTFQRFRLVPYGNHSYIEVLAEHRALPLYGSGGFRYLWDTKFDSAMVAFLDCLQQFKEEVEKGDSGFSLPYRMERGKIEDVSTGNSYSIKIQLNSEEQWTKALKFVLTNLKWGLAWVSSQFTKDEAEVPPR
ncbi:hypothetical protein PR048_024638 [Dryococelus australis]|uniref:Beclin-1 n=1 Tax=Dryococelus australis TaxID=614101 RepID=A0ABQ9GP82_9NEOP|nr:hypothetical protein PR048_024638 [Dryococelus australis]